ncbi:hypothetical protein BCR42DRAFT_410150 [Absidia repens]|uniref:Uncharacterized protein n=1 Tax=Absidia repens TaxID=90262 RepID=A0A1X2INP5_9FUNG|nr:hypothetical protein BCR42DRAFT_410150 [Absidia repens]
MILQSMKSTAAGLHKRKLPIEVKPLIMFTSFGVGMALFTSFRKLHVDPELRSHVDPQ